MYLKVYYNPKGRDASVAEVKAALPTVIPCMSVDNDLGYPAVAFPQGASWADRERVRKALQQAGFETED
jgi:hypothetical protein